jgi:hypothetical protein
MGLFWDITIFGDFGFLLYVGVHLGRCIDTFLGKGFWRDMLRAERIHQHTLQDYP